MHPSSYSLYFYYYLENIESGDYELNCPMYECENNIE